MSRLWAAGIVVLIGLFLFLFLSDAQLGERQQVPVSEKMVQKNVLGTNPGPVIFGQSEGLEEGSANLVTSIVVGYRALDTLGEIMVLFLSALGVGAIAHLVWNQKLQKEAPSFILKTGAGIVFPMILVFGVYVFSHGHLSPGGGFQGGSILAIGILLLYIAFPTFELNRVLFQRLEGFGGVTFVVLGVIGALAGGAFLFNFLPNGVVGQLFSAGLIPILYLLIGLKVGSELGGILRNLYGGE
ncbi:MAG TPA: MnhB domain-containing protein [Thermotogota bacterium]|nr:MnhB domain-containing protein [Thermotogota bacterium]HRW93436.1 MnhB domain-containing protein [Thermotogota bacterium]